MARQITTSACSTDGVEAGLSVAYLANGSPNVFVQDTGGNWSASGALDIGGIPVSSLAAVPNNLFALDQSGNLYVSVFDQQGDSPQPGDWGTFQKLMTSPQSSIATNPPTQFDDFSAAVVRSDDSFLLIVASQSTASPGSDAGFFAYTLQLSGAETIADQFAAGAGTWAAIAQSSVSLNGDIQFSGASAPALAAQPIAGSADAVTLLGFLASGLGGPPPSSGPVRLYYDTSGRGVGPWASYGNLYPSSMPQSFYAVAAGPGNLDADGAPLLQVVALSYSVDDFNLTPDSSAPFLMWQADDGSWAAFPEPDFSLGSPFSGAGPRPGVYPVDLAMGNGYGAANGQNYLQVPILGSDSNVYLLWQSPTGAWTVEPEPLP